ncbi:MAG TPA: hypothetical protein VJZ76_19140 [Thermoanaerobaculia bacterium]|nr:hypothetical protein [Thermoanaerobaculia bacterium]
MRTTLFVSLFFIAASAFASCGSSSCPLDLHALGLLDNARFVLDLSFQSIDQDHVRRQSGDFEIEHDELRTLNRLTTLQLTARVAPRWQLGVTAPFVSRTHEHVERDSGDFERWRFGAFGDAAVQARFRAAQSLWLTAGVKLPTGAQHETNGDEEAEVTIQPGTGSTDVTLGATWQGGLVRDTGVSGPMGSATLIPLFASASYRRNGRGTHDYRRGNELQVSAGSEYPLTQSLHVLGQLNLRRLAKDDAGLTEENPELTGGTYLYVSPGLRFLAGGGTSLYGYVQLPVMQRVNGVQLVSHRNVLVGIQKRF